MYKILKIPQPEHVYHSVHLRNEPHCFSYSTTRHFSVYLCYKTYDYKINTKIRFIKARYITMDVHGLDLDR